MMSLGTKMDAGGFSIKVKGCFDFDLQKEYNSAVNQINLGLKKIVVNLRAIDDRGSSLFGMLLVLRLKVAGNKEVFCIKNATADANKSC
jgi:hypothetical protein